MNIDDIFEMLMSSDYPIDGNFSIDQLTDLIIDSGIDISAFSKEEISQLLEMCVDSQEVEIDTMNATQDTQQTQNTEISFKGAGKCYRCYGSGVIWNFSEGKNEKCYVCGGSGIGPE